MPNGKLRFAAIYGTGAVMGWSVDEVKRASMWEFMAALDGYIAHHSSEEDGKLSNSEVDELYEWLQSKE